MTFDRRFVPIEFLRTTRYFHAHPQQAMFSLIASMLLAALVVLALALSAR
jgi:hypothetical protein